MSKPYLSVVTPTYNRAHLLEACRRSLCRQTDKDFEWIVVDDGSTDGTQAAVAAFPDAEFPVIYVKKENGGKHTALNAAHPYIRGRFVLVLDSDDRLTEGAVAAIRSAWSRYEDSGEIGLVTFLRRTPQGQLFAAVSEYDTPVDIMRCPRRVYLGNDCCEVIRTELFLQHPFPEFPGERFLSEGVLWSRVGKTHKGVYINDAIYICEYLEDGLTKAGRALRIRNPRGGRFAASLEMVPDNALKLRIKNGLLYCCYSFFAKIPLGRVFGETKYKFLTALCVLPGFGLYGYWKKKYQ